MNDVLLTARALACERDGRLLFDNLSFRLSRGDVVELSGPNGAGKTTLLRILAGLARGDGGSIEPGDRPPGWLCYLGHRVGLSAGLTPFENLRWHAGLEGEGRDATKLRSALERVGLGGYEDTPCQHLSAGQQRRAAVARLLCGRAELWLLDEPYTALDASGCALVRELLDAHRRSGGAALCATHHTLGLEGIGRMELGASA